MELTKVNEAYNLVDNTDIWESNGNVTIESAGNVNIGITSRRKAVLDGDIWYSVYYNVGSDKRVSANFSFGKDYDSEYVDYCEALILQILSELK